MKKMEEILQTFEKYRELRGDDLLTLNTCNPPGESKYARLGITGMRVSKLVFDIQLATGLAANLVIRL
jgi:hypothetical protein